MNEVRGTLDAPEREGKNVSIEDQIRNVQNAIGGLEDLAERLGAYSRPPQEVSSSKAEQATRPPKLAETLDCAPVKLEGAACMIRELTDALGSNLL